MGLVRISGAEELWEMKDGSGTFRLISSPGGLWCTLIMNDGVKLRHLRSVVENLAQPLREKKTDGNSKG